MIASSSRVGSRAETGWGTAPSFQQAHVGHAPVDGVGQGDGDEITDADAAAGEVVGEPIVERRSSSRST